MKYKFQTKPYRHQVRALKKMLENDGGALFMDPGTGKTKVAIDFTGCQALKNGPVKALVVCPLVVVEQWPREIGKHQPPDARVEWEVVNYDKLTNEDWVKAIMRWAPDVIIADESQKIKNHVAKRSKAMHRLGARADFKLALSGTPVSKHHLDLFSQFKFIRPEVFGTKWKLFKLKYAFWGGYMSKKMLKPRNMKLLRKKIRPFSFHVRKEHCLDLPKYTHQVVPVHMGESRGVYDTLARDFVVDVAGEEVVADNVLTRLLRLSQITGGWLRGEDLYHRIGKEKIRAAYLLLQQLAENDRRKIVIFARFKRELRDLALVAKWIGYDRILMHGGVKGSKRDRAYVRFEESKRPTLFIAQIATGGLGRNELVVASEAIFYSHDYSWDNFKQACDRLHRIGQKKPVTYYHMVTQGSVDAAVMLALRTKRNLADLVLQHPEAVVGRIDKH